MRWERGSRSRVVSRPPASHADEGRAGRGAAGCRGRRGRDRRVGIDDGGESDDEDDQIEAGIVRIEELAAGGGGLDERGDGRGGCCEAKATFASFNDWKPASCWESSRGSNGKAMGSTGERCECGLMRAVEPARPAVTAAAAMSAEKAAMLKNPAVVRASSTAAAMVAGRAAMMYGADPGGAAAADLTMTGRRRRRGGEVVMTSAFIERRPETCQ